MISRDEMMPPLLHACPSFRPIWEGFVDEWKDDREGLPLYLALGDLASHLIGMLARREFSNFPANFEVVEKWHVEGDSYVKEAATVGLIESLQNEHLHAMTNPEQFRPFLGPVSVKWWDKLYGFWERGEHLRE